MVGGGGRWWALDGFSLLLRTSANYICSLHLLTTPVHCLCSLPLPTANTHYPCPLPQPSAVRYLLQQADLEAHCAHSLPLPSVVRYLLQQEDLKAGRVPEGRPTTAKTRRDGSVLRRPVQPFRL